MSTAHAKVWNGTAWVPGTGSGAGGVSLRTYQETIGDGRNTEFTVTHNLGKQFVDVAAYLTGEEIGIGVTATSATVVTLTANPNAALAAVSVVVTG